MKRQVLGFFGVFGWGIVFAGAAQAQVFTPSYQSPRLVNELSIHVSDGPGDMAVGGIWRAGPLGLRLDYVDAWDGMLSVGGELRNPIPMTGAPLGLAFTAGGQALIGDENLFGFQAGLSAGYTFTGDGLSVTPYLHPRAALVKLPRVDDFEFELLADVGADIEFHNNILLRFGVKLDDVGGADFGFGIGVRR